MPRLKIRKRKRSKKQKFSKAEKEKIFSAYRENWRNGKSPMKIAKEIHVPPTRYMEALNSDWFFLMKTFEMYKYLRDHDIVFGSIFFNPTRFAHRIRSVNIEACEKEALYMFTEYTLAIGELQQSDQLEEHHEKLERLYQERFGDIRCDQE